MTLMWSCVKGLDGKIPVGEIVVFRSLCAILVLLCIAAAAGKMGVTVKTKALGAHVTRGLSGAGGLFLNALAVTLLPLTEAVALSYVFPLITLALALVLKYERVEPHRWIGAITGFMGVGLALSPMLGNAPSGGEAVSTAIGVACGLGAACCSAFSTLHIRRMSKTEHADAIVFYFSVVTGVIGAAFCLGSWVMPTRDQLLLLLGAGMLGVLGQLLFVRSLKHAHASIIAPLEYSSLVWSMMLSYVFFGQSPTRWMICGALVIVASGAFTACSTRRVDLG